MYPTTFPRFFSSSPRLLASGLLALMALFAIATPAQATRIKEVAAVQGVRSNPLTGYGLVVGLDGTGDQTTQAPFTGQSMTAMLQQFGVLLPPGVTMQVIYKAAMPYLVINGLMILLILWQPKIAMLLPSLVH